MTIELTVRRFVLYLCLAVALVATTHLDGHRKGVAAEAVLTGQALAGLSACVVGLGRAVEAVEGADEALQESIEIVGRAMQRIEQRQLVRVAD